MDLVLFEAKAFFDATGDSGYFEYRARHVLELGIFNAWANFRKGEKVKCVELEVGWDGDKLVISVAGFINDGVIGFMPGTQAPKDSAEARISRMLTQIQEISDGLVVRHSPKTGRLQVIAMLDIKPPPGEAHALSEYVDISRLPAIEDIKAPPTPPTPPPATPMPLSDSGIDAFVADERVEEKLRAERAAELDEERVVAHATGTVDETEVTIKAGPKTETDIIKVKGSKDEELEKIVIGAGPKVKSESDVIKVKGTKEEEELEKIVFGAGPSVKPQSEIIKVKGAKELGKTKDQKTVIEGSAHDKIDDFLTVKRIGGRPEPATKGTGPAAPVDTKAIPGLSELPQYKVSDGELDVLAKLAKADDKEDVEDIGLDVNVVKENVQVLTDTIRPDIHLLCPNLNDTQFAEAFRGLGSKITENYLKTLHHLMRLKNIKVVAKVKHLKEQIVSLSGHVDELKSENRELLASATKKDDLEAEIHRLKAEVESGKEGVAKRVEDQVRENFEKYQRAIEKGEIPEGASGWAKGMMENVLKDRALLTQRMRSIDAHLRKREYDFRTKESGFKESLRMKEEGLRQKEFALQKTKESLTTALHTMDKLKAEATGGSRDAAGSLQKLMVAERLLETAKESNEHLNKRTDELLRKWHEESGERTRLQKEFSRASRQIEELKRKIAEAGPDAAKGEGSLSYVAEQRDRALKVVDELKRQAKELQNRLMQANAAVKVAASMGEASRRVQGVSDVELKHKLDHSNKLVKALKDELERIRKRFDEVKLEETKLRVEVGKLQMQLRTAGRVPPKK
jgi:hypothetical protein